MASEASHRIFHALTRRDGIALVLLPAGGKDLPPLVEQAFPTRLAFTLTPRGDAAVVLPEADIPAGLSALPPETACRILRGLCAIGITGERMSGTDNRARRICALLFRDNIIPHTLSLSDIGALITVDAAEADRAMALISRAFPPQS